MSNWKKDKGLGPWDFTPSVDKPRYDEGHFISTREDPIWPMTKQDDTPMITHTPCGYWTKDPVDRIGNHEIYRIFIQCGTGIGIIGFIFDGHNIYNISYYDTEKDRLGGIVNHKGFVCTVDGTADTSILRLINIFHNVDMTLPIQDTFDIFNNYDIGQIQTPSMVKDPNTGNIYYTEHIASEQGGRIMKISKNLTRDLRGFVGSVVLGTDDNYYMNDVNTGQWTTDFRPITGTNWALFYDLIQDNISDRSVQDWGDGTLHNGGDPVRLLIHNNYLYAFHFSSNFYPSIYKYDLNSLEYISRGTPYHFCKDGCGYDNYIYSIEGTTNTAIGKYKDSDLSQVSQSIGLIGQPSAIIEVSGYLIVCTTSHVGVPGKIYKIDPYTLDVLSTYDNTEGILWQRIADINGTLIAVGGNTHMGIFDITKMDFLTSVYFSPSVPNGFYVTNDIIVIKEGETYDN